MITSRSLERRVERVEAEASAADVDLGVLFIPLGLTPTERAAWSAGLKMWDGRGLGCVVIPRRGALR